MKKITNKDLGKRVQVTGKVNELTLNKEPGKIVHLSSEMIGVQFDIYDKHNLHSCSGYGLRGHCWYINVDDYKIKDISIIEENKKKETGIRIQTQKVINGKGEPCRKIISVKALPKHKLPNMYLHSGAEVVYRGSVIKTGLVYIFEDFYEIDTYYIGKVITEKEYQTLLKRCRLAGENLRRINKELKELKQEWNGKETVII